MKVLVLCFLIINSLTCHAIQISFRGQNEEKCDFSKLNNVLNFSAYTIENMSVSSSDFHGLSGSGNKIVANNFHFGPLTKHHCGLSVSVRNSFAGVRGRMDGALEVTNPRGSVKALDYGDQAFLIPNRQYSKFINHDAIIKQIYDFSDFYANLKTSDARIRNEKDRLVIDLGSFNIQVVKLQANQIFAGRDLEIYGQTSQTLILNILGPEVEISHMELRIHGLYLKNIIWNFPDARKLVIGNMGGVNDTFSKSDELGHDGSMGLQGLVIAPHATTYFNSTKITGSLLVANIALGRGPTGQIDPLPDQGPLSPCLILKNPLCIVQ